ncbi:DDE-type integrase/transposase/recombinase, partial [Burkholderia thailandensis]
AGLAVRRRRKRQGVMIEREQLALPGAPNEVWSIDFVMDALSNGRRVKCLTVVDDFTKEAVDIVVDHGISGLYVARALDRAARFRGYPKAVRTDQGPEFTSRALDQWAYANGVTLKLIRKRRADTVLTVWVTGFPNDWMPCAAAWHWQHADRTDRHRSRG